MLVYAIEAIEATRLPAITPAPCTRASAGRRPLVAVVRSIDLFTAAAEEIILAARLRGGIRSGAAVDEQSMARLDAILMPPAGATLPSTSEMEQENHDLFK